MVMDAVTFFNGDYFHFRNSNPGMCVISKLHSEPLRQSWPMGLW